MFRPSHADGPRELTGRTVLAVFLVFFGVVFAVNAVMVHVATSTFGGVETASSYKAGLAFRHELESARAQDARGWSVQARLSRNPSDDVIVEATVRDGNGRAPTRLSAIARLAHPADARRDHTVILTEDAAGRFRGLSEASPGQWDLIIDLTRDGERAFRSKSRVILR
jgi:nitrogen fixation protein FixH